MTSTLSAWEQVLRDKILWSYGYFQGWRTVFPHSISGLWGRSMAYLTSFVALPLPLLSFLALPLFGGTSTSLTLAFFYLTWSSLVFSHDPLGLEIYGTLAIRALCFLLPALGFLAFDCGTPSLSTSIKAYGERNLPSRVGDWNRLGKIATVATFNVLVSVALQAIVEVLFAEVFHLKSILKVTSFAPLPWSIAKDILKGLAVRGVVHYTVHRYLLHTYNIPLKTWHSQWQHSVQLPFSLAATYDHPVCHILSNLLPDLLPAYLFRFHVLTWYIFVALTSLETLFIYSGYAVLLSSIVLAGMARRTDAHFITAARKSETCNFGHWGILDFVLGTSCKDTASVLEDLQDEAQKHRVDERVHKAARGALDGLNKEREESSESESEYEPERDDAAEDDEGVTTEANDARNDTKIRSQGSPRGGADGDTEPAEQAPPKRRSARRKA